MMMMNCCSVKGKQFTCRQDTEDLIDEVLEARQRTVASLWNVTTIFNVLNNRQGWNSLGNGGGGKLRKDKNGPTLLAEKKIWDNFMFLLLFYIEWKDVDRHSQSSDRRKL